VAISTTAAGGIIMPFDSNDYPLGKEYQARIRRHVDQDRLVGQVRPSPFRKVVTDKRRIIFTSGTFFLVMIFFVISQYVLV
jgi:hypothetical protein